MRHLKELIALAHSFSAPAALREEKLLGLVERPVAVPPGPAIFLGESRSDEEYGQKSLPTVSKI